MSTPAENPEKKPVIGKVLYGITVAILAVVMLLAGFIYLGESLPQPPTPTEGTLATQPPTQMPTQPPIQVGQTDIRLNVHSEPVSLLSQGTRDYLAAEKVTDVTEFFSRYWGTESRSDRGKPLELSYTVHALPDGVELERAVFRLFEDDGTYADYEANRDSRSVLIYNLRSGTEYRYSGIFTLSDGTKITLPGKVRTAAGPRFMNIDGLVNVRDLGGWGASDGKTVKQGLLYRGGEMDAMVEADFKLTAEGLAQMKALGIKTDLDLRHAGEDVLEGKHFYYSAIQYEHAFTDAGKEAVRKLFADLADPANYPAYLHCTYGADRTGTMCYLLLGLLGVSNADLKRDYDLTGVYYGYVSTDLMNAFIDKIQALPGENTQAKVEYFLESTGVTRAQMESIRKIFLG